VAVAATFVVTTVLGNALCVTVMVLVGVGTSRHEHASETTGEARPNKKLGVGTTVRFWTVGGLADESSVAVLLVDVETWRFLGTTALTHVVTVTAPAVSVTVAVGAVTAGTVTVGTVNVGAVRVFVPVVEVTSWVE
jgi:hypothetical protein